MVGKENPQKKIQKGERGLRGSAKDLETTKRGSTTTTSKGPYQTPLAIRHRGAKTEEHPLKKRKRDKGGELIKSLVVPRRMRDMGGEVK